MTPSLAAKHDVDFVWFVWLRWSSYAGQVLTILAAQLFLGARLPLTGLFAVVAFEAATNVVAHLRSRRTPSVGTAWVVGLMVADLVGLTGLLYGSGGPFNPFNFLYIVHIALASVMLEARWVWGLVVLAAALFGGLFLDHIGLTFAPGATLDAMFMHVQGMWVGFVVAASFTVYFVTRVSRALRQRENDLSDARERTARTEQLASLGTLAAGAAHELGTPLATIAVAAGELAWELDRIDGASELREDVELIRHEVQRCRTVLDRLAVDAGHGAGTAREPTSLADLVDLALDGLSDDVRRAVDCQCEHPDRKVNVFARLLGQALRGVIVNAVHASPPDRPVIVRAEVEPHTLVFIVQDEGPGMAPDVLSRAPEPFFTTRPPGEGMGLGLFLTRTIVERLAGHLTLRSAPGEGTTVTLRVPLDPFDEPPHEP